MKLILVLEEKKKQLVKMSLDTRQKLTYKTIVSIKTNLKIYI